MPVTKPRRPRSQRLPFQELDLAAAGLQSLSMTLNTTLHRDGARALRKLGLKDPDKRVVLASSRTYREQGKDYGVGLRVEVLPSDETIVELEYRQGRTPRRSLVNFDRVWGLLVYPATSGAVNAFVIGVVELTEDRMARLPITLPLNLPGIPETAGEIRGVRFAWERDGKRLYEAWLDLHPEGYAVTLIFQRDVPQVATAAEDLLHVTSELIDVFLVGSKPSAGG